VAQSPDRPFVPHRTPTTAQPAVNASEFRLSRPFVPGGERAATTAFRAELTGRTQRESSASLKPIEDFLDLSPESAAPATRESNGDDFSSDYEDVTDELPPVEHFLDPLPPVDEFAPGSPTALEGSASGAAAGTLASEWADMDWQQYNWEAVAALGESGDAAASNDWAATDWDANRTRAKDVRPTAADAIASALDQIAQRIRDGDVSVPMPGAENDPATIAAQLAALLGIRK
jgi:hypothetical protein